jgi:predicted DNA-binding transcriptional regulator YafY
MRAARLLQLLLILQNRGQQTCADLAKSLEVSRRTILRDIDALTEAGLPVIVHRGNGGGVELGFGYRTRLTGLDQDEAEAMGLLLAMVPKALIDLGMAAALRRAQAKLREAFPDQTRAHMARIGALFPVSSPADGSPDPRREALGRAVRQQKIVVLRFGGEETVLVHPVALELTPQGWLLHDCLTGGRHAEADWGNINVSQKTFAVS